MLKAILLEIRLKEIFFDTPTPATSKQTNATAARVPGNASPRVAEDAQLPRVRRSNRKIVKRIKQTYPIGTKIYKDFDKKYYKGSVVRFDDKEGYYKIRYRDKDTGQKKK